MAMNFGQGLIQSLINPGYGQGLFTAGQAAGQLAAGIPQQVQRATEQKRQQERAAMQGMLTAAQTGELPTQVTPGMDVSAVIDAAEVGRQRKKEASQERTLSLKDEAELYKYFTPDSIPRFKAGEGPLEPIKDTEVRKAMSTHGQRLQDEGFIPGTPEFIEEMALYNRNVTSGALGQTRQMTPLEQAEFLEKNLMNRPRYNINQERLNKIRQALAVLPGAKEGRSENIKLLQRTVSELYNADTRAASEIDRLLINKGVKRNVADWITSATTGDISESTKNNLIDIIEASEKLFREEQQGLVNSTANYYGGFIDPDVLEGFKENKMPASEKPEGPVITTQEEYDALPSGAIYFEDNGRKFRKP